MTFPPDGAARSLCVAADEALTEATFRTGDFAEADRLFTQAQALAAGAGDWTGEAFATGGLGMVLHHRNLGQLIDGAAPAASDVDAEEELMRRALVIWQETGDAAGTARGLFGLSLVFQVLRRDWDAGMPYLWQAFGLAEAAGEAGDLYGRSEIHRHLGFYYLAADPRPQEAIRQLGHSLALREKLGDPRRIPSALVALGEAELAAGHPPRAVERLTRAVALAREANLLPWRIRDAEQNLREAESIARATSQPR
jgi:tetratricopeptide (TPR) repeat protein